MRHGGNLCTCAVAMGKKASGESIANRITFAFDAIVKCLSDIMVGANGRQSSTEKGKQAWKKALKARNRVRHMALRSEVDPQVKAVQDWLIALLCTTHWVTGNLYDVIVKPKDSSKERMPG